MTKNRFFQKSNKATSLLTILALASISPPALAASKQEDPEKFYRAPGSLHGKTVLIPIGSHIEGRMLQTISSRKSRQGERFFIEITSPVLANGTDVVIPVGSRVIGEVVEAISAGKQPHQKGFPKPNGKLRTQISMLQTPDGVSHPLIASIAGEYIANQGGRISANEELYQPNLGYAGSQSSFAAVHPTMGTRNRAGKPPEVVDRRKYFKDPILGHDKIGSGAHQRGTMVIRSMVKKGREIYILGGSPLTIRIDAPLKISIAPSAGRMSIDMGANIPSPSSDSDMKSTRRFQPTGSGNSEGQSASAGSQTGGNASFPALKQAPDPEAHLPVFLRSPKTKKKPFLRESSDFPDDPANPTIKPTKEPTEEPNENPQASSPESTPIQQSQGGSDDF